MAPVASSFPEALRIARGCTVCGLCEALAPEVFEVTGAGCRLRPEGRGRWDDLAGEIFQAARMCPSGVIREGKEERSDG